MWDLPGPGLKLVSSATGRRILNHCITREVPVCFLLIEEMDKFPETYDLPRLNHAEIENLNKPIVAKETVAVTKNLSANKSPEPDGFTDDFPSKRLNCIFSQQLPEGPVSNQSVSRLQTDCNPPLWDTDGSCHTIIYWELIKTKKVPWKVTKIGQSTKNVGWTEQ